MAPKRQTHQLDLAGRMRAQLLAGRRPTTVPGVVEHLLAIQAQAPGPTRLAVRARSTGLAASDVDDAVARREVVRTWLMRGTLHLVPAADARWLVRLFSGVLPRQGARRRAQLGLDDGLCARALDVLAEALRGGRQLARAAILDRLTAAGIRLDRKSQAPIHLIAYAATTGLLVRGPDASGDEPTYVLLDEWLPPGSGPDGDDALVELARRYLAGRAPATEADFRAWSGLPAAWSKKAWSKKAWSSVGPSDGPAGDSCPPRLLGHFDEYLLGYKDRDAVLDPAFARRIQAGGGFIQPAVLVDGRVAGTWKATSHTTSRRGTRLTVAITPFTAIPRRVEPALRAEAEDVARFLGADDLECSFTAS